MTDVEALNDLIAKLGRQKDVADALGVSPQTLHNWLKREKISAEERPKVWALVNDNGGNLPREWLMPAAQHASAA